MNAQEVRIYLERTRDRYLINWCTCNGQPCTATTEAKIKPVQLKAISAATSQLAAGRALGLVRLPKEDWDKVPLYPHKPTFSEVKNAAPKPQMQCCKFALPTARTAAGGIRRAFQWPPMQCGNPGPGQLWQVPSLSLPSFQR